MSDNGERYNGPWADEIYENNKPWDDINNWQGTGYSVDDFCLHCLHAYNTGDDSYLEDRPFPRHYQSSFTTAQRAPQHENENNHGNEGNYNNNDDDEDLEIFHSRADFLSTKQDLTNENEIARHTIKAIRSDPDWNNSNEGKKTIRMLKVKIGERYIRMANMLLVIRNEEQPNDRHNR